MNEPKTLQELFDCPDRWVKGALSTRRGGWGFIDYLHKGPGNCFCLLGAIQQVYPLDETQIRNRCLAAIKEQFPNRYQSEYYSGIVDFNNHPETTFSELRAVIEKANV
jgi:hypothetical protein